MVRLRVTFLLSVVLAVSACSKTWDDDLPSAPAGGTGLVADTEDGSGQQFTSSVGVAPATNGKGTVPPFGSNGQTEAYEFSRGYRVGAGDRLDVRVLGQSDLTGNYIVSSSGHISIPLINSVHVAGMTSKQIEKLITRRLRNGYLRDPAVAVQVSNLRPFFILGEVSQAGGFPYQAGMTVQNAVALAGGYSARANHGEVLLTRKLADGTKTSRVPVTTQLYPGDIIFVRERWF